TVSDLEKSKIFYTKLPGFKVVAQHPNFIMLYNGFIYLGLTDHENKQLEKRFDEKNVGLDHVSFEVASRTDLFEASKFFKKENIDHGEIQQLSNGLFVLAFRDPDNIQLELSWRNR
ncbi:VOC family protein, partial [Candidatus Gottesmanbacteria bacterium]|nr:VOC family protein [Candidatus Gottesmanbacteria bacterium]